MNAKPRAILALVGIFLAGTVTGVLLPWRPFPRFGPRPEGGPRPMMTRILERMDHELELTADQRKQVELVLRDSSKALDLLRQQSFKTGAATVLEMNTKIEALLTPAQREKFAQMQRDQIERMRQHQPGREPFGPGRDRFGPGREGMPPPPGGFPGDRPPGDDLPLGDRPPPPQE